MNRLGVPESEQQELLAYLKNNYKYENGGIVNRRTGRRHSLGTVLQRAACTDP